MPNFVYNGAAEGAWKGEIDWVSDDMRALLIDTTLYTAAVTDGFLDEIPGGAIIASAVALGGKTISGRTLQTTNPITFPTVAVGNDVTAIVVYLHTGTPSTSRLVLYVDTAFGLPAVRDGLDVRVSWSTGTNKIVRF